MSVARERFREFRSASDATTRVLTVLEGSHEVGRDSESLGSKSAGQVRVWVFWQDSLEAIESVSDASVCRNS